MICPARLCGGPLVCVRTDEHEGDHVFESTSGVPDRHELGDDE